MSTIEEIKERIDIVELVSQYTPLKKSGRAYKGRCPFHTEKTASFVVYPDDWGYHCFGCHVHGNGFDLLLTPTMAEPPPLIGDVASTADDPWRGMVRAIP